MTVTIISKDGAFKPYIITGVVSIMKVLDYIQVNYLDDKERPQIATYELDDIIISMVASC